MKIYVCHSNSFDYQNNLYKPLRDSEISKKHTVTLPHEFDEEPFNSKGYIKVCDLVFAEVSYPSTGQGIELGWADLYKTPIICFHKKGLNPSRSLKVVSNKFIEYDTTEDMIKKLMDLLKTIKSPDIFN